MTQEEKATAYDDLVRDGDKINRKISTIKTSLNRTPEQESELITLNGQLQVLEDKLRQLYTM
jgi:hypothetical protein